jgi:hypothetical protein
MSNNTEYLYPTDKFTLHTTSVRKLDPNFPYPSIKLIPFPTHPTVKHGTLDVSAEELEYYKRECETIYNIDSQLIFNFLMHFIPSGTYDKLIELIIRNKQKGLDYLYK